MVMAAEPGFACFFLYFSGDVCYCLYMFSIFQGIFGYLLVSVAVFFYMFIVFFVFFMLKGAKPICLYNL